MKKINLLLAVLMFSVMQSFGQQVETNFGVKGGLNISNLSSDDNTSTNNAGGLNDPSSRFGAHAGLTADVKLMDFFGIGVEALYSQQGTHTESEILGITNENKFQLDYINLPILAKAYLGDFNVYGGVQPGFLVNAKQKTKVGSIETEIDLKTDDAENQFAVVKEFDFSIPLGLGYRSSDLGLAFDARYNLGTTAVFEGDDDSNNLASKNRVFQVSVGYTF